MNRREVLEALPFLAVPPSLRPRGACKVDYKRISLTPYPIETGAHPIIIFVDFIVFLQSTEEYTSITLNCIDQPIKVAESDRQILDLIDSQNK